MTSKSALLAGQPTELLRTSQLRSLKIGKLRRIADGQLGPIYHVLGSYQQDWLLHDTDFNWRVLADEGGALRAVASRVRAYSLAAAEGCRSASWAGDW